MKVETLYRISSINCYINEDLIIYPVDSKGRPDTSRWNNLENLSSIIVNQISIEDDKFLSKLINRKVKTDEYEIYYEL
jgi:hypothetical protein